MGVDADRFAPNDPITRQQAVTMLWRYVDALGICLSETGLEGIPDLQWWTETLYPSIREFPISYVLTWRNAWDQPGHFYAAWDGYEGAADMKAFSEQEQIVFLR